MEMSTLVRWCAVWLVATALPSCISHGIARAAAAEEAAGAAAADAPLILVDPQDGAVAMGRDAAAPRLQ